MKFTLHTEQNERQRATLPSGTLRILFLVAMLVLVLMAMNRAGQPESWSWLFPNEEQGPQDKTTAREATSDQPPGDSATPRDLAINPLLVNENGEPVLGPSASLERDQLRLSFWAQWINELTSTEQMQLLTLVDRAVEQRGLTTGETSAASALLSKLESARQDFQLRMLQVATSQNSTEIGEGIVAMQAIWEDELRPALRAVVNEQLDGQLATPTVLQLPELLRKASSSLIADHTQVGRPKETFAWFAAWASIFDAPVTRDGAEDPVSATQLLSQPKAYRGTTVTINGQALRVDVARAGKNYLGIEKYYVVWVKPDSPSRYPFCIYSLMLPEDLAWDEQVKSSRDLDQAVSVTGEFFKVRLFDAGEPAQAPLIMTSSIELLGGPIAPATVSLPSGQSVTLVVLLLVAASGWIAWRAYQGTSRTGHRPEKKSSAVVRELDELRNDERVETVSQKLERLNRPSGEAN